MVIRLRTSLIALLVLLAACNPRRSADASGVDQATLGANASDEDSEASQTPSEDTSHDARPDTVEEGSKARPAAASLPDVEPPPALEASGVQRAVADLATWAKKKGGSLGAAVIDVHGERRLAESDARRAVNPASNQKILTAASALHYLGPAYRFKTELRGRVQGGSAEALVLWGQGDPSLSTQDLWRLARVVREQGLSRVGAVYVDQSHFDEQYVPPAFEQQPNEWAAFRAPVSAVSIEQNTITLNVVPKGAGERATFWFDPPGVVDSRGFIETGPRGSGDTVRWSLQADGPRGAARLNSTVGGGLGAELGRRRYTRRMDDPRMAPGYALCKVLADLGVEVQDEEVRLGTPGPLDTLAYVVSEPLGRLLHPVGKESDNFYAETLFKVLGSAQVSEPVAEKGPATSAAGARAVLRWLERAGIETEGVVIKNGSGLFDANRVSPNVLAEALVAAYREPAIASEMIAQLAIGGVDGTLRKRLEKLAPTRIVRAKTGTLRNVVALSGYVMGPGGRAPVAFSLLVGGVPNEPGEARRRMDRVVEEIAAALWSPPSAAAK